VGVAGRIAIACVTATASFLGVWGLLARLGIEAGSAQALAAMAASLVLFGVTSWVVREPPGREERLARVARMLADIVTAELQREEEQRLVHDPVSLPVRWRPAPDHLADHPANVAGARVGESADPVQVNGRIEEIAEVYRSLPTGRLVILGRAGSGKTVLTGRLALDLLENWQSGAVPVVVGVGSWNSRRSLRRWLADRLMRDLPALRNRARRGRPRTAARLVYKGHILPILDGFDEIDPQSRSAAFRALNDNPTVRLVLTSRMKEYAAAVAEEGPLKGAAVVALDDLTVADLADYLPRTAGSGAGSGWDPVVARLTAYAAGADDPAGAVLARVLSTPLMVFLARTIYSGVAGRTPTDLLDAAAGHDVEWVERELLEGYVRAVYEPSSRARVWLTYLARDLRTRNTRDLAWWQLRDGIPAPVRFVTAGLLFGLAFGLVAGVVIGLAGGLDGGRTGGLGFGVRLGLVYFAAAGLAGGAAFGLALRPVPALTRLRLRIRLRGRIPHIARQFGTGVVGGLAFGVVFGLGAGTGFGYALGSDFGVIVGVITFLAAGLTGGLTLSMISGLATPVDIRAPISVAESLASDRRTALVRAAVSGVLGGLVSAFLGQVAGAILGGSLAGVICGGVMGFEFGFTTGLMTTAWGQWLVFARLWLPLAGRLPWRLPAFLQDAYRRGVLRQAGATYQFRHATVQDHLASAPQPAVPE